MPNNPLEDAFQSIVRNPDEIVTTVLNTLPLMPQGSQPPAKWEPQKLNTRHREILRRLLEGATYVEIAEEMGITPQSIMLVATSKLAQAELQQMEAAADFQVIKRADELSNEALDTLKLIMRKGKSDAVRKSAAESILDRAGYGKIEKKLVGVVDGEAVIRELNRMRREKFETQKAVNE